MEKWQARVRSWVLIFGQDLDEILVVNARDYDAMFPKTRVFEVEFEARFLSVRDGKASMTSSVEGLGSLRYRADRNSITADFILIRWSIALSGSCGPFRFPELRLCV